MAMKDLSRREFTAASVMALLAGVTVTVSGCSSSYNPSGPNPNPSPSPTPTPVAGGDKNGVISANHGHVATVTAAQITAAGAVSLDIHGTADHTHTVELTAAEVQQIGVGTRVAKTSTTNSSHEHTVTFN
jgi:hypothetical protein